MLACLFSQIILLFSTIMSFPTLLAFLGSLGGPELFIIAALVLILFGAKKLPIFARSVGKSMGEFKKARDEFEQELHRAHDDAQKPAAPLPNSAGNPQRQPLSSDV
jgi:sec-independent protein translocase protein TatA